MKRYALYAIRYTLILAICLDLIGCDAFVRKFTRKKKKEDFPQEELVLAPEEYKGPQMSKDELYHQCFFYWRAAHDELINALWHNASYKKRISCAEETIKSLLNLRPLLNEQMQKKLDDYITKLKELKGQILKDTYGIANNNNRQSAERLKRNILRDLSYPKIKNYLI